MVLAISFEIDKRHRPESSSAGIETKAKALSSFTTEGSPVQSTSMSISTENETIQDWTPTSTASASAQMSQDTCENIVVSPVTVCDDHCSTSSLPTTPTKSAPEAHCECGAIFRGFSCATNLQRHRRSTKVHNNDAEFECLHSGCGKRFTRSDNMNHHFRENHHPNGSVVSYRHTL